MDTEIVNKLVKLIWEDKNNTQIREGRVLKMSDNFLTIKSGNKEELIPLTRILRIEIKGGINKNGHRNIPICSNSL